MVEAEEFKYILSLIIAYVQEICLVADEAFGQCLNKCQPFWQPPSPRFVVSVGMDSQQGLVIR
jgi:hypothetical protein